MRKLELAEMLADTVPGGGTFAARVAGQMARTKSELLADATARDLPMTPTNEVWFEVDGADVPGGKAGETWFAVFDVPAEIPADRFDRYDGEEFAWSWDDCPRYFTDAGRTAAAEEPTGHADGDRLFVTAPHLMDRIRKMAGEVA